MVEQFVWNYNFFFAKRKQEDLSEKNLDKEYSVGVPISPRVLLKSVIEFIPKGIHPKVI